MTCQRCRKECIATIVSMFNTEEICLACKKAERERPDYAAARDAEMNQVRAGNYNYQGIGLPGDGK